MQYSFVAIEGSQLVSFAANFPVPVVFHVTNFPRKKLTGGSARLDLRRFGEAPPLSKLRFLACLRLSSAFFLISSAVSLILSCCFDADSAFARMVSSLSTNSSISDSFLR